jgi:hypothetical protein
MTHVSCTYYASHESIYVHMSQTIHKPATQLSTMLIHMSLYYTTATNHHMSQVSTANQNLHV